MNTAAEDHAEEDPQVARKESELRREDRADERTGAGDRREVVAEEDDPVRRVEVLSVLEPVRRRRSQIVEDEDAGSDEGGVVPVRDREDGESAEHPPGCLHAPQSLLRPASLPVGSCWTGELVGHQVR